MSLLTDGNINCYSYPIPENVYQNVDIINVPKRLADLRRTKECIRNNSLLDAIKDYDQSRCLNFKEHEDLGPFLDYDI
jgi:hypothetical protein